MRVVTYATHSFGTFEEIVGNPYGIHVDVLGFGTKWTGFMDKIKGVVEYLERLPHNEIVIFIDGFDSKIQKPLDGLEEKFKSLNCKVLISKDPQISGEYITKKIFSTCTNNQTANSGLYMGEAKFLRIFLSSVIDQDSDDDQRNFNSTCSQYDWVKTDSKNEIFYNVHALKNNEIPTDVYFISYPATPSIQRYTRGIKEYYQFFIREISLVFLIAALILFMWKM
jgi:hypothetical protein